VCKLKWVARQMGTEKSNGKVGFIRRVLTWIFETAGKVIIMQAVL
jgi:hypothetical protein